MTLGGIWVERHSVVIFPFNGEVNLVPRALRNTSQTSNQDGKKEISNRLLGTLSSSVGEVGAGVQEE